MLTAPVNINKRNEIILVQAKPNNRHKKLYINS